MDKSCRDAIVDILLRHFPDLQAVYLFGSHDTDDVTRASDVDLAILLPPDQAESSSSMILHEARFALEKFMLRDVDLVNLRKANTVLCHEVVKDVRRIFCADTHAADVFEMLVMSYYQKLNEERADILDEIARSGKVLA